MSDVPPASADRSPRAALRLRRRRALASLMTLAASIFMWPAILQIEHMSPRVERLKVLGAAQAGEADAARGRPTRAPRATYRRVGVAPTTPYYGALREGLPSVLAAQLPPAEPAAAAIEAFVQGPDFAQLVSTPVGPGLPLNPPRPGFTDPNTFVTEPGGGPGPGPGGGNPPVVNPPVVDPTPNPPVTNPPVVDPGNPQPPVVTPPVVQPPVDPPPIPPIEGPPGGTFTPPSDPGDPGGGGPGGGPPHMGVPEPAVWVELVLGAGLAGAALRRARRQPAAIALRAVSRRSTTT